LANSTSYEAPHCEVFFRLPVTSSLLGPNILLIRLGVDEDDIKMELKAVEYEGTLDGLRMKRRIKETDEAKEQE
jgi:hypothetical protein